MPRRWVARLRVLAVRPRRASTYFLVLIVLLAASGTFYLWRNDSERHTAFVANTDLPAYHQLVTGDIREVAVRRSRLPDRYVRSRKDLVGRYIVPSVRRGRVFSTADLGPSLPSNALAARLLIALPATAADIGVGMVSRGDRVNLLLSSTEAEDPRSSILRDVLVLDVKPLAGQSGEYAVVYAVHRHDESQLLSAGGTAKLFIVRTP